MRTLDGRLLADLNDNILPQMTGSVEVLPTSSVDENLTTYILLPERINAVPYISSSIYTTSTPQIKPIQFNDPDKYNLFVDQQGVVKVAVGSSFTLRLKGMQPPIYNVENGVPTQYVDQNLLTYEWQKDGAEFVSEQDPTRPNSFVSRSGEFFEELNFFNVSPKFAGTYVCVVSNDIGSVESEQVVLEIYNPDLEDKFYSNLVENPYGKNGTDTWNSPDIEFTTGRFNDAGFEKFSQPWNTDLFGYSVDMLYPRPYQINTHHIRNSTFTQDLIQEGYYFTRERFKYRAKDGKSIINASTDVDLSTLQEYIQGSIYGIQGVKAIFGCYIGNAISKYRTSLLNALITRRTTKFALIPSKARLDIINVLLAGVPIKAEEIRVDVQEYDNETALLSNVNGSQNPGITFVDPWTNAIYTSPGNVDIAADVPSAVNVVNDWVEAKIVEVIQNNRLFPSDRYVPTFGQCAYFNRAVIDKLNFRTNKIRINIKYETWINVINVTDKAQLDASDECFEHEPWDWITIPLHWPKLQSDFAVDPQSGYPIGVDWYNQKVFNLKDRTDVLRYATLLGPPRAMTTGFNLILVPIETNAIAKTDYYTRTILSTTDSQYPRLKTGTSPASQVGVFLGSISDYTYEIIGVNITNRYNWPFNGSSLGDYIEAFKARGEPATRTTIQTFKYNKSHSVEFPEVLDFSSAIWSPFRFSTDTSFTPSNNPQTDYIIVFNSGSGDLIDANIEQVAGNIQSNIIKYTNNLITDVPATFVTRSILKRSYLGAANYDGIGFTLNLVGEDYGIATTESVGAGAPFKTENLKDWRELKQTTAYNHYYSLMSKVDQPGVQAPSSKQHIIYSNEFAKNWWESENTLTNQSQLAAAVLNAFTAYGQTDPKLNLASSFNFTRDSYYETGGIIEGISQTDEASAKSSAVLAYDTMKQLYTQVNVNGNTQNMRPSYVSYATTGTRTDSNGDPYGVYLYTLYLAGRTRDVVKLPTVQRNDIKTPAAIVIPSEKKIYYFIYNYIDNSRNEV